MRTPYGLSLSRRRHAHFHIQARAPSTLHSKTLVVEYATQLDKRFTDWTPH